MYSWCANCIFTDVDCIFREHSIMCLCSATQASTFSLGHWKVRNVTNFTNPFSFPLKESLKCIGEIWLHFLFCYHMFTLTFAQTWNLSRPPRPAVVLNFCQLCKFFQKTSNILHILQVYTHLNVNFLHNCKRIYTFCSLWTERGPNYWWWCIFAVYWWRK